MREGSLLNFAGAYRRILQEEHFSSNSRGRLSSLPSSVLPLKDFDSRDDRSTEDLPLVSGHQRRAFAHKWRTAVYISTIPVLFVLLVNLVATIWAAARFGTSEGLGILYSGSCDVTAAWARWLHIFINILGSILLSCSNYAMQLLVAPTRREVDQAHSKRSWVDIGVPSVRNLRFISFKRAVLWSLLALSSIPLHLLYNSAVFQTLAAVESYNVTVANEGFLDAAEWIASPYIPAESMADIVSLQQSLAGGAARDPQIYQNLTNAECLRRYSVLLKTDRKDVIAITSATNIANHSLFLQSNGGSFYATTDGYVNGVDDYLGQRRARVTDMFLCTNFVTECSFCLSTGPNCGPYSYGEALYWACYGDTCSDTKDDLPGGVPDYVHCSMKNCDVSTPRAEDWEIGGYPISYCLSQRMPENCELQFSQSILIIVIICNLMKVICLFFCAKLTRDQPLVTLGDAIASFLEVPDTITTGLCLVQKRDFTSILYGKRFPTEEPRPWRSQKRRWFSIVSKKRWALTMSMCLVTLVMATLLLNRGVDKLKTQHDDVSLPALFRFGLGAIRADSTVTGHTTLTIAVLVANLPQVLVSFIYLFYNALFTCLLMGSEWASLSRQRKPLRVSLPQGEQRSTYWLQLPYRYAVPMIMAMTTLHWLISQSIFLVRIKYFEEGEYLSVETSIGFSCIAIFFSIMLGLLMVIACVASGFPKLQGDLPLAGSCSLAISAVCHRPDDDVDAARRPVMWGEMEKEDQSVDIGHCCITSEHVVPPTEGRLYAGRLGKDRGLCDRIQARRSLFDRAAGLIFEFWAF